MKKFLTALLGVVVLASVAPATAFAAGELLATEHLIYAPGAANPLGESYPGATSGTFDCDTGTFELLVQNGHAYGPFAGTFGDSLDIEFASGFISAAAVAFDVDAGGTTISGTAVWISSSVAVTCTAIDEGGGDFTYRFRVGSFSSPLHFDYAATVNGPGGTSAESGSLHGYAWFDCWNSHDLASCEGTYQLTFDWPDPDHASLDLVAGGTLTTGTGEATPADPTTTSVYTPNGGIVTIDEGPSGAPPATYQIVGQEVTISAPQGSAEDPLFINFRLDASVIPPGEDASTIQVFRDGEPLPECQYSGEGSVSVLPCVSARFGLADGDVQMRIVTDHASVWNMAVPAAAAPPTATAIATVVDGLPDGAFKAKGHRTAMASRLAAVQKQIDSGKPSNAAHELGNLRRQVDGCGTKADKDDWIVDCDAQLDVRAMFDELIAYLGG